MIATKLKSNPTECVPITIWGVSDSPYVRKVMVALAEKELSYELREILPSILLRATGQVVPADFEKASPLGKIPALRIGDFYLADSRVIANYLDRKFATGTKLYPSQSEEYARTLWFEQYADGALTEVAYKKIFLESVVKPKILNIQPNFELIEQAKNNELPPMLDYLESSVKQFDWIACNDFSMADIAITMQLLALQMAGFEIIHSRWPVLNFYLAKITSRSSFKKIIG